MLSAEERKELYGDLLQVAKSNLEDIPKSIAWWNNQLQLDLQYNRDCNVCLEAIENEVRYWRLWESKIKEYEKELQEVENDTKANANGSLPDSRETS